MTTYDWRDLVGIADHNHNHAVLREVLWLRALGRTPDDIGILLGINPADVHLMIFGCDEEGAR
jgi:hypothetical protein